MILSKLLRAFILEKMFSTKKGLTQREKIIKALLMEEIRNPNFSMGHKILEDTNLSFEILRDVITVKNFF